MDNMKELIEGLHRLQLETLFTQLKTAREVAEAGGDPVPTPLLSAVNRFLKDNGVDGALMNVTITDPMDILGEPPVFEDAPSNIFPMGSRDNKF